MAAITAAVITAGAAAYGAHEAGKAGDAVGRGADAATAEQRRQFDLSREDTQWIRDLGRGAGNQLASLYGLGSVGAIDPATGVAAPGGGGQADYSGFMNSPDYLFARDEGQRGIERSAAARGGLASGNTLASLSRFNSGLATQNLGNYANRLAGIMAGGQQSSTDLSGQRMQLGQQIGQNAMTAANARASGIQNQANIWMGAGNQLAGAAGYWSQQRRQPMPYGGTGAGMGTPPYAPQSYAYG